MTRPLRTQKRKIKETVEDIKYSYFYYLLKFCFAVKSIEIFVGADLFCKFAKNNSSVAFSLTVITKI